MSVAAPERLTGRQEPVIHSVPPYVATSGPEAVELAAQAGLILDPWQQLVLRDALGERADGRWSAFEAALVVARQNGKGAVFEARVLAGLFLLDEQLIMYSAHEFKTAQEMFRRIEGVISGNPSMRRRVKRVTRSHGEEGIELVTGQRLRFVARSTGSGRGFSGDCNIWDEAQNLSDASVDALMPTMSARPNPQLLYGGSAPDRDLAPCDQIARVRLRALKGDDPSLAYFEWSAELCTDTCRTGCGEHDNPADPDVWAKANPGMGYRVSLEHIAREHTSMSAKGFARERLSIGNWPTGQVNQWTAIPEQVWRDLNDSASRRAGRVMFAIDATPGGTHAAIGVAGVREDDLGHLELIEHRRGTGWIVDRAVALKDKHDAPFVVDPKGPAGFLIADLEDAGVAVLRTSAGDVADGTSSFIAGTGKVEGNVSTFRVMPHPALDAAVAGAVTKPLGDGMKWDRRSPVVDISPLVAITLARHGLATYVEEESMVPLGAIR